MRPPSGRDVVAKGLGGSEAPSFDRGPILLIGK
jgi:hypothetical protein